MSARPVEHEHARDGAEFVEGGGDQSLYVFRVADCAVAPTDDSQWGTPIVVVLRDGVMAATGVLEVEEHLHSYPDLDGDGVAELVILRGQVSAKLGPSLSVASFHKRRNRPNPKKDFIAAQPATMPAMEVVAAAKKVGLVLSKQYVYQMRSKPRGSKPTAATGATVSTTATLVPVKRKGGRPKGSKTKSKTVAAAPIAVATAAAPAVSRPAGASDMHKGLAQYVMTHGAQRVREALAEVEAGLSRVFGTT